MSLALIPIAFFAFFIPLLTANKLGAIRYFSPLHIAAYLVFFGVLVKTLWFYSFGGTLYFENFLRDDRQIYQGYLFMLGFIVLLCAGYAAATPRSLVLSTPEERRDAVKQIGGVRMLAIGAFLVAGIVLASILASRGLGGLSAALSFETLENLNAHKITRIEGETEFGASDAALKSLLVVPTLALVVLLIRQQVSGKMGVLLLAMLALEFYLILSQGKRFALVTTLMTIMMATALLGKRFTSRQIGLAAVAGIAAFALFVTMTTLRLNRGASDNVSFDITPAIEQVVGSTYFLDVNSPILIIALADERDRFWGASYMYWTYAWIPRAFWPGKPVVTLGPYMKREILGVEGSIGGVNPTGPGEAFINFGWFGLAVAFLLGALYRGLEIFALSGEGIAK